MAFLSKFGNILKQTSSKLIGSEFSLSNPSLYQAIRCMSSKLFVGGLSYNTDEQSMREVFAKYGDVIEARIIQDRETGRSRGFGFVTYTSTEEASSAIQALDGQDLHGRLVKVNYATERARPAPVYYDNGGYGGSGGSGNYNTNYGGNNYPSGGYNSGTENYRVGGGSGGDSYDSNFANSGCDGNGDNVGTGSNEGSYTGIGNYSSDSSSSNNFAIGGSDQLGGNGGGSNVGHGAAPCNQDDNEPFDVYAKRAT